VYGSDADIKGEAVRLSRSVARAVWRFDTGLPIEPFNFILEMP
jgi:hypothetical protein